MQLCIFSTCCWLHLLSVPASAAAVEEDSTEHITGSSAHDNSNLALRGLAQVLNLFPSESSPSQQRPVEMWDGIFRTPQLGFETATIANNVRMDPQPSGFTAGPSRNQERISTAALEKASTEDDLLDDIPVEQLKEANVKGKAKAEESSRGFNEGWFSWFTKRLYPQPEIQRQELVKEGGLTKKQVQQRSRLVYVCQLSKEKAPSNPDDEALLSSPTSICHNRIVSNHPLTAPQARLPPTPTPAQSAASTGIVARPIAIPGLEEQPVVLTQTLKYDEVSQDHITWLLASEPSDTPDGFLSVGLDTEFDGPLLGLVQLATNTRCLLVVVAKPKKSNHRPNKALDDLLRDPSIRKTGCELTKDALLLFSNFGHILRGGIDLTHVYSPATLSSTRPATKGLFALFSEMYLPWDQPLRKDKATTTSKWVGVPLTEAQLDYGVLDAWVSYKVGVHDPFMIASATVLDLSRIDPGLLNSLADQNSAVLAIDGMQQKQYDSKFSDVKLRYDGKYDVVNSQFRNKLHFNDVVLFHLASGEVLPGKVEYGDYGKTRTVKLDKPLKKACDVDNITVVEQGGSRGMDSFLRDVWLKLVLHGQLDTSTVPFFGALFLSQKQSRGTAPPIYDLSGHDLNPSQTKAVNTMLSARKPLTLIHGPPGTGKTFAITAAVAASISSDDHHFYVLTCQTNAATRNLAMALLKRGVTDFKIVVSDNFFVEWHEDQYKMIDEHVIKSSETRSESLEDLIGPRTVVLCSLSQLSNPNLVKTLKRRLVTHLVIDEASQIFIANLQHVLALYQSSLKRLTLVGDPKQLAPFGSERHSTVQSVFERLQSDVMLNIQYRMPCDLGAFISTAVYKNKLVSRKKPREVSTVALIDVESTEQKSGKGITNPREADAVVQIIVNQFLTREFLVITPYNAQKELIADRLRAAIRTLHSQGKTDVKIELADERVHTVDTVQGQEADLIVFSAVRTTELGFLSNRRRMNVALTRAKDQLVIVAHMSLFRTGHGKNSLLGAFVQEMEKVTPVVNSKRLSTGLLLDFKRKPLHATQGKQMHPAGPIQSTAGTSAQAVSSKGQFITPNCSSAAVDGATEVNSRGKHWKSNQKKEKKKEELWQNKRKNDGYDARTETSHEIATKTTFEVTSFKRTTYKDITETADQGATKTPDLTGERKRWVPRTNKNKARKNDDKLGSKSTK